MAKQLFGTNSGESYIFSASGKTIEFFGNTLSIENILLINNATRETVIFNPFSSGKGYSSYSNNKITLELDTSGYADADKLQIFYDNSYETFVDFSLAIKNLYNLIARPVWLSYNPSNVSSTSTPALLVNPVGGTISTITTVSTVTTVSQIAGEASTKSMLFDPLLNQQWEFKVRNKIITT